MNQILRFLNSHASCRQFTDQAVTGQQERDIVFTGQRSPTSSNLQAYSIIGIRDPERKKSLAELVGGQQHVIQCPLFFIFCADLYRLSQLNRERGYDFTGEYTEMFIIATVDTALVACRSLMAAQAMGLSGVMVGGIRNHPDKVADLVKLPELVYPVMGMSIGYPAKEPKIKPRLPESAFHFSEEYDASQIPDAVKEYDEIINALGYLKGREVEPEKYESFDGTYSWSEHTARRMASHNPGTLRPHMLPFLRERGFLKK